MLDIGITVEQELTLNLYDRGSTNLSKEEAIELLLELVRQSMVKDNIIKKLIKEKVIGSIGNR